MKYWDPCAPPPPFKHVTEVAINLCHRLWSRRGVFMGKKWHKWHSDMAILIQWQSDTLIFCHILYWCNYGCLHVLGKPYQCCMPFCQLPHFQHQHISQFLTVETAKSIVRAFVSSKLDYCNSIMCQLPDTLISRLQGVQNTASRLVTKTSKFDHITPKQLHWLPVKYRITFKILPLTYRGLNGMAPQYIQDLLHQYEPARSLHSAGTLRLDQPDYTLETYGARAFSVVAPQLWNKLPLNIRRSGNLDIFKNKLKTRLYVSGPILQHLWAHLWILCAIANLNYYCYYD